MKKPIKRRARSRDSNTIRFKVSCGCRMAKTTTAAGTSPVWGEQLNNSICLRDYQVLITDKLKSLHDRMKRDKRTRKPYCIVMPTGSGKSVVIAMLIRHILGNNKDREVSVLVTTWSRLIMSQNETRLKAVLGVDQVPHNVDFCTVQALKNFNVGKTYDHIIIDECHKMFSGTVGYSLICSRMRNGSDELVNANSSTSVWGFTATPYRNRHENVINKKMFTDVGDVVTYSLLIRQGYLVPPEFRKCSLFEYDREALVTSSGDYTGSSMQDQCLVYLSAIAEEIRRVYIEDDHKVSNRCVLVFLPTLRICREVKQVIDSDNTLISRNVSVRVITGSTGEEDRERIIRKADIILNCGVLTTGVDITRITSIVLARATKSWTLFRQMVGRGLRLHKGKSRCNVVDCGGNVAVFGDDLDAVVSNVEKSKKTHLPVMSICPSCMRYIPPVSRVCKYCGKVLLSEEEVHLRKLERLYFENGMREVKSAKFSRIDSERVSLTVSFHHGKDARFVFSKHPYSVKKMEEYADVLAEAGKGLSRLFLKIDKVKGFDTIVDAKLIEEK